MILEFTKVLSMVNIQKQLKLTPLKSFEWRFLIHKYTHITTDCIGVGPD